MVLAMDSQFDCKDLAASGLFSAVFSAANNATAAAGSAQSAPPAPGAQGERGAPGLQGEPGPMGISCWDLNANGVGDPDEDANGDGDFNSLDCQGVAGADGADGAAGPQGDQGPQGLACWDLNANGVGDLSEDANGDGSFDTLDCQGPSGSDQIVAQGVIMADGTIESGDRILSVAHDPNSGSYLVHVDVAGVESAANATPGEFPVLLTVRLFGPGPQAGEGGFFFLPIPFYEPVELANDVLTVTVIIAAQEFESPSPFDAPFSIAVLEPLGGGRNGDTGGN